MLYVIKCVGVVGSPLPPQTRWANKIRISTATMHNYKMLPILFLPLQYVQICGEIVNIPSYEFAGLGSTPNMNNQHAALPAVSTSFWNGQ